MKIIIAGTGEVASYLAEVLANESQDVIVIGSDVNRLAEINASFNVLTHTGDPTSVTILQEMGISECKMFIALLRDDTDNMIACSMAKKLGAAMTVARVTKYHFKEPTNEEFLHHLGVDHILHYEYLAAREILTFLTHAWAKQWVALYGGRLFVVAIKISDASPMVGQSLSTFTATKRDFHVAVIKRGIDTIIPCGSDVIQPGDILYFTVTAEHIDTLAGMSGNTDVPIRKVVIMGGSEIAVRLSNIAPQKCYTFKLIEKDEAKCRALQSETHNCTIIHGDGTKIDTLSYAGQADAFVALSKIDEVNILSCVTAREMGAGHVIANVEDIQNIPLSENFNINAIINRKLLASTYIFQLLLSLDAPASKIISLTDAEIVETTAQNGSPITKGPIATLKLPRDITLAGVIHDGRGMLVNGDTNIHPGDHTVVVCRAGAILKVKQLFTTK